jgi:hypothetical protein
MRKPVTYGVKEAHVRGVSGILLEAERNGLVRILKHDQPAALVIPLSALGMRRLQEIVSEVLSTPSLDHEFPEIRLLTRYLSDLT